MLELLTVLMAGVIAYLVNVNRRLKQLERQWEYVWGPQQIWAPESPAEQMSAGPAGPRET